VGPGGVLVVQQHHQQPMPAAATYDASALVGVHATNAPWFFWLAYLAAAGPGLGGVLVLPSIACSRAVASPSHPANG